MKKLFVIPMLLLSTGLFAQKFQLGLKAGPNLTSFNNGNFEQKARVGFTGGAFVSFLLGDNFAIQPELLFSTQGVMIKNTLNAGDYKANYLSVPVLAKYRFNGGFYLEAGPQAGFKLSENIPNSSINSFAKNLDLAIDAGLGYHGNGGFGVGARYCLGITKVGDFDQNVSGGIDPDFKYGMAQLFVFFTLFNNHRDH